MYPRLFNELVDRLQTLPGVGLKTAQRYAFDLLKRDQTTIEDFCNCLLKAKEQLAPCPHCGFIADGDNCPLCQDPHRDQSTLLVVSYVQDVVAIEKTGFYHGLYHVLNGVISAAKGIYPEDLALDKLLERLTPQVKEVIIATSPTLDGETTALYLDKILTRQNLKVTRLAHGLPMGSSLAYADDLTLIKALDNRRQI